jgi:hypothetical protein
MALRSALGTAEPILCLWLWSAENATDGSLAGLSRDDVERAAEWHGKPGLAFDAMVKVGFIDEMRGLFSLHNWMTRTGAGIESLIKTRIRQREIMKQKRSVSGDVSANVSGDEAANPLTLSLTLSESSQVHPDPEPPLLDFPCDGEPASWALLESMATKWSVLYPHLDIMSECRKALAWIDADPERRKTARGMKRFLVGWFGRAQNRGNGKATSQDLRVGHGRAEDADNSQEGDIPL